MRDIKFKEGKDLFNYRVAAVIKFGDNFLFQKMPGDNHFTLVGGRVRFMETTKEAIRREILEEINYDIVNDDYEVLEIAENFFDYKDDDNVIHKVQTILFIYKIILKKDSVINQDKSFVMSDKSDTTLHWISKNVARDSIILPEVAKRLIDENTLKYEIINDRKYD